MRSDGPPPPPVDGGLARLRELVARAAPVAAGDDRPGAQRGHALLTLDGRVEEVALGPELLRAARSAEPLLWLDVTAPRAGEVAMIGAALALHPLAVRGAERFAQQPRLYEYDDCAVLVACMPGPDRHDEPVEVHAFLLPDVIVTLHHRPLPSLGRIQGRFSKADWVDRPSHAAFVLGEGIAEEYERAVERLDTHLDHVEEELVREPSDAHLGEIQAIRKTLRALRRSLIPTRDAFGELGAESWLGGRARDDDRYLRRAAADLGRAAHRVEETHDRATSAMDVYVSRVGNRMSQVMQRLTLVATICLPLTVVAGYFGQNFAWMTDRIDGPGAFLVLGVLVNVVIVLALIAMFRRRGWV